MQTRVGRRPGPSRTLLDRLRVSEGYGPGEPGRLRGECGDGSPLAASADAERNGVSQIRTEESEPPTAPRQPRGGAATQNNGKQKLTVRFLCQ